MPVFLFSLLKPENVSENGIFCLLSNPKNTAMHVLNVSLCLSFFQLPTHIFPSLYVLLSHRVREMQMRMNVLGTQINVTSLKICGDNSLMDPIFIWKKLNSLNTCWCLVSSGCFMFYNFSRSD